MKTQRPAVVISILLALAAAGSLAAFLAWVGLGADGLWSSCYGPAEAFRSLVSHDETTGAILGDYRYLAIPLALAPVGESKGADRLLKRFPALRGAPCVLFLSRLDPKKNIEVFLRAAALCKERFPQASA